MQQEINFYPLMKHKSRWADWLDPQRLQTFYLYFLVFLMLIFLKDAWHVHKQSVVLRHLSAELQAGETSYNVLVAQSSGENMQNALEKLGVNSGASHTLLSSGRSFPEVLKALSEVAMSGVWLTAINLSNAGDEVSLTGATINPAYVQSYLESLSRQTPFQHIAFALGELESAGTSQTTWMSFQINGKAANG